MTATVCFAVASLWTGTETFFFFFFATRQCCCSLNELVVRVSNSRTQACTNTVGITVYFASPGRILIPHKSVFAGCKIDKKKKKKNPTASRSPLHKILRLSQEKYVRLTVTTISDPWPSLHLLFPAVFTVRVTLVASHSWAWMSAKCLACKKKKNKKKKASP